MKALTGLLLGFLLTGLAYGHNIVAPNSPFQENQPVPQYVQSPVVGGGVYPQVAGTPVQQVSVTPQAALPPYNSVNPLPTYNPFNPLLPYNYLNPLPQYYPFNPLPQYNHYNPLPQYNPYYPISPYNPFYNNYLGYAVSQELPDWKNINVAINLQPPVGRLPFQSVVPQVSPSWPQYPLYYSAQFSPYLGAPSQFPVFPQGSSPQVLQAQVPPPESPIPSFQPAAAPSSFPPVAQGVGPVFYK